MNRDSETEETDIEIYISLCVVVLLSRHFRVKKSCVPSISTDSCSHKSVT